MKITYQVVAVALAFLWDVTIPAVAAAPVALPLMVAPGGGVGPLFADFPRQNASIFGLNPGPVILPENHAPRASQAKREQKYDWLNDHLHQADNWLAHAINHPHDELMYGEADFP